MLAKNSSVIDYKSSEIERRVRYLYINAHKAKRIVFLKWQFSLPNWMYLIPTQGTQRSNPIKSFESLLSLETFRGLSERLVCLKNWQNVLITYNFTASFLDTPSRNWSFWDTKMPTNITCTRNMSSTSFRQSKFLPKKSQTFF